MHKNFLQAFKSVTESLSFHIIKYQNPWMYRTLHCYLIGYVWFIWCACISHQGSSIIYARKGRGTGDFEGGRIFWTPPGGLWLFRPPQGRAGIFSTPPQRGLDFFRPPLLNFFSKKCSKIPFLYTLGVIRTIYSIGVRHFLTAGQGRCRTFFRSLFRGGQVKF